MSRYYRYMSVDETQVSSDALEVTDAALSTVLEVRSEEDNPESTALRVAITGSNGPEFSYDLSFEDIDEAGPEDHIYQVNELTVIIPKSDLENLTGATLDLPSNPMQGGLVIRNPNRPKMLEGEDIELTGTPGQKLQQLLDTHINPSLAAHSGYAELVKMDVSEEVLRARGMELVDALASFGVKGEIIQIKKAQKN